MLCNSELDKWLLEDCWSTVNHNVNTKTYPNMFEQGCRYVLGYPGLNLFKSIQT